jgi:hypothetical protein
MDLTQLEWIKTELKQRFYGENKMQGPTGKIWKLLEVYPQETEGIYIIMYINRGLSCKNFRLDWI